MSSTNRPENKRYILGTGASLSGYLTGLAIVASDVAKHELYPQEMAQTLRNIAQSLEDVAAVEWVRAVPE